jgi:hypothetical protein
MMKRQDANADARGLDVVRGGNGHQLKVIDTTQHAVAL